MSEPTTRILDLSDYWNMVRARRWVVVITAVVLAFASATFVRLKPNVYVSSAKVVVLPLVNQFTETSGSTANALAPDMGTESEIVKSLTVAGQVQAALNLKESPQAILKRLSVNVVRDTTVMVLSFKDPNADAAETVAQEFAKQYLAQREATVQEGVDRAETPLLAQIKSDEDLLEPAFRARGNLAEHGQVPGPRVQAEHAPRFDLATHGHVNDIQSNGSATQGGDMVQDAVAPNAPTGPNLPLAAALGLFVGAMLGCAIAIVSGLRENKVGGRDELAHHLSAPVMAVIPGSTGGTGPRRPSLSRARSPAPPPARPTGPLPRTSGSCARSSRSASGGHQRHARRGQERHGLEPRRRAGRDRPSHGAGRRRPPSSACLPLHRRERSRRSP